MATSTRDSTKKNPKASAQNAELVQAVSRLPRSEKLLLAKHLAGELGAMLLFPKGIVDLAANLGGQTPKSSPKETQSKKPNQPKAKKERSPLEQELEAAKKALHSKRKELKITEKDSENPEVQALYANFSKLLKMVKEHKEDGAKSAFSLPTVREKVHSIEKNTGGKVPVLKQ